MEKLSHQIIPGLIIRDVGNVTAVYLTADEIEELEEKPTKKQTTARKPEFIRLDAGTITRVDGKLIRYTAEY